MKKANWVKIAGSVLPFIGIALSAVSNFVEKKELDAKVAEEVAKALQNQAKGS